MNDEHADAVLERLNEEIEWREQELNDLDDRLAEIASDVDDWLCNKDHVRMEEALNGLSSRLDDGTRSMPEELALLIRIRDGEPTEVPSSEALPTLPRLSRETLESIPLPAYEDDEESFDARERFELEAAADHLRAVLRHAEMQWRGAWSSVRKGDAPGALHGHDAVRESLQEVDAAYALWFECLGALCNVSPGAAGVAGEMVMDGMAAFRQAKLTNEGA
jgi:hypothetical protein